MAREEVLVSEEALARQRDFEEKVRAFLHHQYPDRQPMAHVHSYGCQQNVSDGEKIQGMLALMGYGFTADRNRPIWSFIIPVRSAKMRRTACLAMWARSNMPNGKIRR